MSELITDNIEREEILCYLEDAREQWLPARAHARRSAGMNAESNAAEARAMKRIDDLLDELSRIAIAESVVSHE